MDKNIDYQRSRLIDNLKGLTIFLMVYGHFIQNTLSQPNLYYSDAIFKIIYSFHMPMFALISGYLFYHSVFKKSLKALMISWIKRFLVPIVLWSAINWGLSCCIHEKIEFNLLFNTITGNYLWFLWSILAAQIIIACCVKFIPDNIRMIGMIIGFFAMYLFPNPEMNLFLYLFFVLGYCVNQHEVYKKLSNFKARFLSIPLWIILLLFYSNDSYIYTTGISIWENGKTISEHFLIDVYRYVIGLCGCLSVIILIKILTQLQKNKSRILQRFGMYSMQVYIIQSFIMKIYPLILNKINNKFVWIKSIVNYPFAIYILAFFEACICCYVCVCLAKIIERDDYISKLLFGR